MKYFEQTWNCFRALPFFSRIAYLTVLIAALGTTYFYGDFSKTKIGPLYILEVLFSTWWIFTFLLQKKNAQNIYKTFKTLSTVLVFFLFGSGLLLRDLLFNWQLSIDFSRFMQHALLFIYPLLWTFVGVWIVTTTNPLTRFLIYSVLALNTFQSVFQTRSINFSLGTLLAIPFVFYLNQAIKNPKDKKLWIFVSSIGLCILVPYWNLWVPGAPRTLFLLLLSMLFIAPFLLMRIQSAIKLCFSFIGIIFLLIIIKSQIDYPQESKHLALKQGIYHTLQHGEDVNLLEGGREYKKLFNFRMRKLWWTSGLEQWKEKPFFGNGFIPEVPRDIFPNVKNEHPIPKTYALETLDGKPLSGPHNSYISVLARMGVIGFLLFCILIGQWFKKITLVLKSEKSLYTFLLFFIPFNGLIHAAFNIGFEAPYNCMLIWLLVGIGLACPIKKKTV